MNSSATVNPGRSRDQLLPRRFPLRSEAFGGEFAGKFSILQRSIHDDGFMLGEIEREAQLAVNPFSIPNCSRVRLEDLRLACRDWFQKWSC